MSDAENNGLDQQPQDNDKVVAPHEATDVASLDNEEKQSSPFVQWVKEHKTASAAAGVALAVALVGGTSYGVIQHNNKDKDVIAARDFNDDVGQQNLPSAKVISGVGKGVFTATDPVTNKVVNADIVGIDTTGDANNATLAPPEELDKIGWYIRSAPFGVDKGSTVLTSHIDYNGAVGLGSLFPTLKKGDPITLTDGNGKEHHYVVTVENTPINKSDPEYIKKTSNTIKIGRAHV